MSEASLPAAAAGFYPDPENAGRMRYWDGQQWAAPVAPEEGGTKRPIWRRWWFMVGAAALAIILIAAALSPAPSDSEATQAASGTAILVPDLVGLPAAQVIPTLTSLGLSLGPTTYGDSESPKEQVISQDPAPGQAVAPGSAVSVVLSNGPQAIAQPAPSASQPAPAPPVEPKVVPPPPAPVPATKKYSGRGDKILSISKPEAGVPQIMTLTYRGSSNFVIESLDASLETSDLLVNEIGSYKGSVLLDADGGDTARVKVTATGAWTMEIKPRSAAPTLRGSSSGRGDQVLKYFGGPFILAATHGGSSNFVIQSYGEDGGSSDLLVNEIGPYSGENTLSEGPGLLSINADGSWKIAVS